MEEVYGQPGTCCSLISPLDRLEILGNIGIHIAYGVYKTIGHLLLHVYLEFTGVDFFTLIVANLKYFEFNERCIDPRLMIQRQFHSRFQLCLQLFSAGFFYT